MLNTTFFDSLSEGVKKEIRLWSKTVLEVPEENLNNLPMCPFAKKAWDSGRVKIHVQNLEKYRLDLLDTILEKFDDSYDVEIIVDLCFCEDTQTFHDCIDQYNDNLWRKDIWLMGYHPYDEVDTEDVDFEAVVDQSYSMIFVQRLSKLQEASDKLSMQGYYKNLKEFISNPLFRKRKRLYRRMINAGYEKRYEKKRNE